MKLVPEHGEMPSERQHIVLTGAMGVGKTTVGRLLGEKLGLPFHDSDVTLEGRFGENAAEIADRDGVPRLHELELEVFLDLCASGTQSVISPASSVADHPSGRNAMSENRTVWLTAPDHVIATRQGAGTHRRPVDAAARAALRARRSPHLEAVSEFVVDTGSSTPEETVAEIIDRLETLGSGQKD